MVCLGPEHPLIDFQTNSFLLPLVERRFAERRRLCPEPRFDALGVAVR